ncbi:unnamed protein product [Musa acuminata subsp. malaccensis]|uniref:(wild Malaysian banana) hypothetical protein n=1 Tax=Musa acuminata subsp. malaccensis TaxID=214687 RepID=A0A804KGW8_MUSAM|nr:unnamed protein product [Musa acuminata subsp. malaccensis]
MINSFAGAVKQLAACSGRSNHIFSVWTTPTLTPFFIFVSG